MEDGHRLVGQVQSLHFDGRSGILFLELDHRRGDLALQLFLHLVLLGLKAYSADQADFGRHPGVAGDAVCQQLFKAHLLQNFVPWRTDGDALPQDGDAAPVQKAVDGHTVRLHFLQQVPQGGFVQRGIAEVVLDLQFKALMTGLGSEASSRAHRPLSSGAALRRVKMTCWLCRSIRHVPRSLARSRTQTPGPP